jgi:hypothetical protein
MTLSGDRWVLSNVFVERFCVGGGEALVLVGRCGDIETISRAISFLVAGASCVILERQSNKINYHNTLGR